MSQLEINAPSDVSLPPRSAFSTVGAKLQASASTIPSDLPDAAAGVGDGSDSSLLLQAHSARMSGDWSSALELYDDAASSDSTGEAEAWLSICYITGLGCGKDQHLAYKHAVNSADKGCAFGLNNLGHCLENGIGCSKNIEQAVRMYERASSSGEPLAMNNLGLCLQAGNGIEKDELRAVQLFKQSAGAGNSHGLNSLGNCYFQGIGVRQNFEQAYALYEQATQNRTMNKSALYNLGCCLYSGKGAPRNLEDAFELFQKAADLGLDIAQYRVGICLRDAIGCARDRALALENFQAAASQGMAKANVALLDIMFSDDADGSDAENHPRQEAILSPGAEAGAGSQSMFRSMTPVAKALKLISPVKSPLNLQDDQEPPMEHSRPATPDPSISQMHLFQLQQEFAEHLKSMRVRHEQEMRALHQHFEPLIATASSLANRTKTSDTPSSSHLYCIIPHETEQRHEAAVEPPHEAAVEPPHEAAVEPQPQETNIVGSSPSSFQFKRIPLPLSSANSSPSINSPSTLNELSASTAPVASRTADNSDSPSSANTASPSLLSHFSSNGISASYRRSVVMRHTQNKLL